MTRTISKWARRHNLPFINVIGADARMTRAAGVYAGRDRFRRADGLLAALEESGELVNTEHYTVNLSKCDRSKTIIEPLVSTQWFVQLKPLAENALQAVRRRTDRFVPDDRVRAVLQWMTNIRDWCISRQLVVGTSYSRVALPGLQAITVARETPAKCSHCHSTETRAGHGRAGYMV